jgi:quinol monooxygenase YgiN
MIAVLELRRYTLKPGARETLVELFDREFVESQEKLGMQIVGTFRDLDDPDQFVWLRGFADVASRAPALQAFYTGPVWKAWSAEANATMVDVDNVLMLRPVGAFDVDGGRPPVGVAERDGVLVVTIQPVDLSRPEPPRLGARAVLVTERSPNDFPALPVRETEAVVWLGDESVDARSALGEHATGEPEILRLAPTPRSLLP